MTETGQIVGKLARDPKQGDRITLYRLDGSVSNRFSKYESWQDVRAILAASGLELRDDGSVVLMGPQL